MFTAKCVKFWRLQITKTQGTAKQEHSKSRIHRQIFQKNPLFSLAAEFFVSFSLWCMVWLAALTF